MTQPPNQPPQGGFGAPQDPYGSPPPPPQPPSAPPPGGQPGYGYPQQPPTSGPGYGYPQQPTVGSPYAQPPTQPGQFGAPQSGSYPPPGQPVSPTAATASYGYPQQPQYPAVPGGHGGPGGGGTGPSWFKGKPAAIIGATLAVLLVAGGIAWAVAGGDDDPKKTASGDKSPSATQPSASAPVDPGDGSGNGQADGDVLDQLNSGRESGDDKVIWFKTAPDVPANGAEAPGMWITDTVAVKAVYNEIVAYKVADGTAAWGPIELPAEVCAVSKQSSDDDKVVVAYKESRTDQAKCNQLMQIDLNTGKKGWTKEIQATELFDSVLSLELYIVKDTLIVGRSQSGAGLRVSDGKQLWEKKEEQDGVCFPGGFAGGTRVIVSLSCAASQPNEHSKVEELDPVSGRTVWSKDLPKGWTLGKVYSTEPVVLYLTNEDKKQWNISTLQTGSSATRSQVDVDENFAPECPMAILESDLQGCQGVAADANTLYLPTDAQSDANEIVAIDLGTGKEKWRVKSPGDATMLPIRVEGSTLTAYEKPTFEKAGAVLSIPTTGSAHQPKTLLQNPQSAAEVENSFFSMQFDYVDGRFYISSTRVNGSDEEADKLMLAYAK